MANPEEDNKKPVSDWMSLLEFMSDLHKIYFSRIVQHFYKIACAPSEDSDQPAHPRSDQSLSFSPEDTFDP